MSKHHAAHITATGFVYRGVEIERKDEVVVGLYGRYVVEAYNKNFKRLLDAKLFIDHKMENEEPTDATGAQPPTTKAEKDTDVRKYPVKEAESDFR